MTRSRLVVAVGVSGHVNVLALQQRDKLKGNSRRVDDSPRVISASVMGPTLKVTRAPLAWTKMWSGPAWAGLKVEDLRTLPHVLHGR